VYVERGEGGKELSKEGKLVIGTRESGGHTSVGAVQAGSGECRLRVGG